MEKEQAELEIVRSYMPQPLSADELSRLIDQALRQVDAKSPGDLGAVMKHLMPQVRGRAEGGLVNRMVRERLQNL